MALIKRNTDGLYLTSDNLDFGSKQVAFRLKRLNVESACRYAQLLRSQGHDVKAVTDHGEDCEPRVQQFTPINEVINYGDVEWRIPDIKKVSRGYLSEWDDSETGQHIQLFAATPQLLFEKLRDVQDLFSERRIAQLPRVARPQPVSQEPPQAQTEAMRGLRPGDGLRYNGETPIYRSYYNPNGESQSAAQRPEIAYADWERTASCEAVKKRAAIDAGFAAWYNGVAAPASNKQ